jgi:hypothetical protein
MRSGILHIPVTVEPVEDGWVSFVDPRHYPRAHFGDTKPYYAPNNLDSLSGPDGGVIKLPPTIYWGPDAWFNLLQRSTLRIVYQMVLEEGDIEDFEQYLNREILLSIWDDLCLPQRLTQLWEEKVEGLRHG